MAIKTKSQIDIENTSYTDKDFYQIYPELVDLAKKLTNKWDPETTDEGDPGLVLLKLLGFIADKNNYNIDKNILEQFMPSVTQDTSMRNLCDMMGYNVGYYRSATCEVSFTYNGGIGEIDSALGISSDGEDTESGGNVFLRAFDTSFKTDDNIVYTLLEDMEFKKDSRVSVKKVMQGELKALSLTSAVSGSTGASKIQLYNLDENNRLYIPDVMVAENGIFIDRRYYDPSLGEDDNLTWRRVDNLNDQELGQRVYKFGFDSKKWLPYIEFPSDIADLIGSGLEVYYVVSGGKSGTVGLGKITSLNSALWIKGVDSSVINVGDVSADSYSLTNSLAIGGSDPETIDEAYSSYRRVVGTFDTLVSCRDYTNAIYDYVGEDDGEYLVSNVQVTDVRTDPNRSLSVWSRDINGSTYFSNFVFNPDLNYNEIVLHGYRSYAGEISSRARYDDSYRRLANVSDIEVALQDKKTLSHTLGLPKNDELNTVEERYSLKVNISTKYRVNDSEQSSILSNAYKALYNTFSSRGVEFGEEIPYDTIVSTIKNSDERIKNVVVDDPIVSPWLTFGNGDEHAFDPSSASTEDYRLVVNNILCGRIQLYVVDSSFNFDYDMDYSTLSLVKNIQYIETGFELPAKTERELNHNEVVQVIEDSYIAVVSYPYGVYYAYKGSSVVKNTPHKLASGEYLYIYYTDSNDKVRVIKYGEGEIFQCSFDLSNTASGGAGINAVASRWCDANATGISSEKTATFTIPMYSLGNEEQIDLLKRNSVTLSGKPQLLFWYARPYLDKEKKIVENALRFEKDGNTDEYFHVLEEDEMFVYPSEDMLSLNTLGSGTKIVVKYNPNVVSAFEKDGDNAIVLRQRNVKESLDLEDLERTLSSNSISNFQSAYDWEKVDLSVCKIEIVETSMSTFVEGEKVTSTISLDGSWTSLSTSDKIDSESDETGNDSFIPSNVTNPKARTILIFNGSSSSPQKKYSGETIKISYATGGMDKDGITTTDETTYGDTSPTDGQFIQLNTAVSGYGFILLRQNFYENEGTSYHLIDGIYQLSDSAIVYSTLPEVSSDNKDKGTDLLSYVNGDSVINGEVIVSFDRLEEVFKGGAKLELAVNSPLDLYVNVFDNLTGETHLFPQNDGKITLDLSYIKTQIETYSSFVYTGFNLLVSLPRKLSLNPSLVEALGESALERITNCIETEFKTFDYLSPLNKSKLISSYDIVNSFFDYNNVYNSLTIPRIDFSKSVLNIVASSLR